MRITLPFDSGGLAIEVPGGTVVYRSSYPPPGGPADRLVLDAVRGPAGAPTLAEALRGRGKGPVVIVTSDITRPIPYREFLPALLSLIESSGVSRDELRILVATGMHRPGTHGERRHMFGDIADTCRIEDHDPDGDLAEIPGTSRSGRRILLNRTYVEAGFRIIIGLVEPHFMAGFSGGRKAICPGLCSMETIQSFHGWKMLDSPAASGGNLAGNPCHEEALSVATRAGADFTLNLVLDTERRVVRAFAGALDAAHGAACRFVKEHACPGVRAAADAVLAGCGGYPLDATFYQCVKGIVAAVPAVRPGGTIIAAGGCREGMGSPEYRALMERHHDDYRGFLGAIRASGSAAKDQWQFQMQARALERTGDGGIVFFGSGLRGADARHTATRYHAVAPSSAAAAVQRAVDGIVSSGGSLAVIPEGPYCCPVATG